MKTQIVSCLALPAGINPANKRVRLSVLFVPRLQTDDAGGTLTLADYADFLKWPERVRSASYRVEVRGGPVMATTVVSPSPEPSRWAALFDTKTRVEPHQNVDDLTGRPVHTYDHAAISTHVRNSVVQVHRVTPVHLP